MSRRNVGLVELLVELVEHHGILILRVVPDGSLLPGIVLKIRNRSKEKAEGGRRAVAFL